MESLQGVMASLDNISEKMINFQKEKQDGALESAAKIDEIISSIKQGDYTKCLTMSDIVKLIYSSSSGSRNEILVSSIDYLKQKMNEDDPRLTLQFLENIMTAALMRIEEDVRKWDEDIRQIITMLLMTAKNISVLYQGGGREEEYDDNSKHKQKTDYSAINKF